MLCPLLKGVRRVAYYCFVSLASLVHYAASNRVLKLQLYYASEKPIMVKEFWVSEENRRNVTEFGSIFVQMHKYRQSLFVEEG